ncbi:hypothetical protein MTR67_035246 [Solanum verrucosum]|uniref:Uncharacterized protein n=1 Tax=Solanum verrucosum TaxID=315347 RepID=A0AAF0UA41_SOLVR|nr:hypothetical protein MTR67_035246 [Solanum verrucosum]
MKDGSSLSSKILWGVTRNSHSSSSMVPQGVLLSVNEGMRLHSCIAQVDFEREHDSFKLMLCFRIPLTCSYIPRTAIWPASSHDANTGIQDHQQELR